MLLKIIILLIVLVASHKVYRKFKDRTLGPVVSIFAAIILISLLVVVFEPHISDIIAHSLGIQRGADIAFFTSILVLIYLSFRLYSKIVITDRNLTALNMNTSIELHRIKKEASKKY
ncbi:MAG TPA: DUF2304 family protein [Patescibacteria group bacterium]